jgi:membrane-bound lytic murein transglycosylase D
VHPAPTELRLRLLLLAPLAALTACATVPTAFPGSETLTPIEATALPRPLEPIAMTTQPLYDDPFGGAGVELEPLPLPAGDLWERIVRGYRIAETSGPLVDKWEDWYAQRPDYVARMVDRSRRYLYHIVNEIDMRGMPLDLALLPMVESAFNPHALSVSRASGIWQFMPATGTTFGLKQSWWFDSRRDVLAATTSALDYLQKLEAEFGDWQLALAAYNWGEGNVRRAVARNQARGLPTDFASLTGVPDETRNYVPKLQALKNIVADPTRYNLSLADVPDAPYFAVVKTSREMDVKRAVELAELPMEEFLSLNPQHNRPVIAGADEYTILLPIDKAEIFAAKLQLVAQPLVSWQAYRVKAGDTLPQVAAKFGMSVETLRSVNGIGTRAQVPVGHALLVPAQTVSANNAATLTQTVFTTVPSGRTFYYTVRGGETLARVSAKFGVTPAEIKRWNGLMHDQVKVGQQLRVTSDVPPARRVARHGKAARSGVAAAGTRGTQSGKEPSRAEVRQTKGVPQAAAARPAKATPTPPVSRSPRKPPSVAQRNGAAGS